MINPNKQPVRVVYKGQQYIVKYVHEQKEETIIGKYSPLMIRGKTTAYIGDFKNPVDGLKAEAFCSIKDQFNKRIGRTISSIRLIKLIENSDKSC